jgi:arylformamidase
MGGEGGGEAVDYEAEYNNRARVPEHPAIIAGWERDAKAYRGREGVELGVSYGASPRMSLDIFPVREGAAQPLVLFIHGGYWQGLDRSFFSHLARGLNARGISVAMPSYDLCPDVRVGEIIAEMRAAAAFLHARTGRPIVVSGHSAGGHLAAALVATNWRDHDPALPADLVPKGLAISGLFDLTPLISTSVNDALKLDVTEARLVSPLRWPVPAGRTLQAWVGGDESDEYLRQSREVAEVWREKGAVTACRMVAGANHFTVIAPLTDPDSEMTQSLAEMARSLAG